MTTESRMERPASVASNTYGPVLKPEIIAAGADVARLTILGRATASKKLRPYDAGNVDGTENPVAVLMEDAAAAAADVKATTGFAGVYAKVNMIGLDDDAELVLEARGIYFV